MIVLVGPVIPALRRYARAQLRDRAEADDLVQDCLERAVGRWAGRRSDGDIRPWLFAILQNLLRDRFRQAARRGTAVAIEAADPGALARPPEQESALRHRDLVAALCALPEDQRSVILLVSVEGLSYAETAQALDVPVGTVMSRLSRGRDRLAAILEGEAPAHAGTPHLRRVK